MHRPTIQDKRERMPNKKCPNGVMHRVVASSTRWNVEGIRNRASRQKRPIMHPTLTIRSLGFVVSFPSKPFISPKKKKKNKGKTKEKNEGSEAFQAAPLTTPPVESPLPRKTVVDRKTSQLHDRVAPPFFRAHQAPTSRHSPHEAPFSRIKSFIIFPIHVSHSSWLFPLVSRRIGSRL